MKYVLDTNALSALMKGHAPMVARLRALNKADVMLAEPALAEIEYGIARLPKSKKKESLRARFELIKAEMLRVEWTDAVSEAFGEIKAQLERKGLLIEDVDVAIAAHAKAHSATAVTSNIDRFDRIVGLRVEDWSE